MYINFHFTLIENDARNATSTEPDRNKKTTNTVKKELSKTNPTINGKYE